MDISKLKGHLSITGAELMWGVSAPVGTMILAGGIAPMILTDCRVFGAALLFWILSIFTKKEPVSPRDLLLMFFASLFGIVINQGCFVYGLSITSPINASIITTSLPILTMIMAAIVLKEPITGKKAGGVFLGAAGALVLVTGRSGNGMAGSWIGDVLVICAQISFTAYLVLFKHLIGRYSPVTLMKWMFTYASVVLVPFTYNEWIEISNTIVPAEILWGIVFFIIGPTFLSYLLLPVGQKNLRPTVTAMYNYVQPIVATLISVYAGLGSFTVSTALAIILVFTGVFLVTVSKGRKEIERERKV